MVVVGGEVVGGQEVDLEGLGGKGVLVPVQPGAEGLLEGEDHLGVVLYEEETVLLVYEVDVDLLPSPLVAHRLVTPD